MDATGAEWVTPYKGDPPHDFDTLVAQALSLINGIAPEFTSADIHVPDRPRTVAIFGDRGQGKSTLLAFVQAAASHDDMLVLPTVDPERFAQGDTMLSWLFAHLDGVLDEDVKRATVTSAKTIFRQLDDLRLDHALTTSTYVNGLARRGVSPEEYSRDASQLASRGATFTRRWARLLDDIASAWGRPNLRVLISIDDADLFPAALGPILADAQAVSASPRVMLLFAAHEGTLRQALTLSLLGEDPAGFKLGIDSGLLRTNDIRDSVQRRMVKTFPRSLRVELKELSLKERLSFRPIGSERSMQELLQSFPVKRSGFDTLLDFFVMRASDDRIIAPMDYAQALSGNRRDLRQLHEALEHVPATGSVISASRALATLIDHGVQSVPSSPVAPSRFLEVHQTGNESDELPAVAIELEGVTTGRVVGFGDLLYTSTHPSRTGNNPLPPSGIRGGRVFARVVGRHYMSVETRQDGERAASNESDQSSDRDEQQEDFTPELSSMLTHLVLLAKEAKEQESVGQNQLSLASMHGALPTAGLLNWANQISLGRNEVVHYWTVPEWEGFSDYFLFAHGWNKARELCLPPRSEADDYRFLERLLLFHLQLVIDIQLSRRLPVELFRYDRKTIREELRSNWEDRRSALWSRTEARMRELAEVAAAASDTRTTDGLSWLALGVPLLAIRNACTAWLSERLLDLWDEFPLSDQQRNSAGDRLSRYISGHVDQDRADAEIEVLLRVHPTSGAELASLRQALNERQAGARANVLAALRQQGLDDELLSSLATRGAAPDVVGALSLRGVVAKSLMDISRLFPPVEAVDPLGEAGDASVERQRGLSFE